MSAIRLRVSDVAASAELLALATADEHGYWFYYSRKQGVVGMISLGKGAVSFCGSANAIGYTRQANFVAPLVFG